ncbi:hypothetical protein O3M35_010475 [Rhynocoris fuscipes]|uniref:Uncharacterized protein n=1 Tax=Rhynocoris fuscipes TaxID=488301 RepID=A0AAW1CZB0_9HEMI
MDGGPVVSSPVVVTVDSGEFRVPQAPPLVTSSTCPPSMRPPPPPPPPKHHRNHHQQQQQQQLHHQEEPSSSMPDLGRIFYCYYFTYININKQIKTS